MGGGGATGLLNKGGVHIVIRGGSRNSGKGGHGIGKLHKLYIIR